MMNTFEQREQGFEAKFHHDLDLGFRVIVRRDKLLGLWAAEKMNMPAPAAAAYAAELVNTDCGPHRDDCVYTKVLSDLHRHGVEMSDHRLRRRMAILKDEARRQVMVEENAPIM